MPKLVFTIAYTLITLVLFGLVHIRPHCLGQDQTAVSLKRNGRILPAIVVRLPHASIGNLLNNEFEYAVPFEEVISQTSAAGKAICRGKVHCHFEDRDEGFAICLKVIGSVDSDAIGKNGPASLITNCVTQYVAEKRFTFSNGSFVATPATVESETTIKISNVETDLPGVRGVVVKRVAMQKAIGLRGKAERAVQELTNTDICKKFDENVDEQVSYVNYALQLGPSFQFFHILTNLVNFRSEAEGIDILIGYESTRYNVRSDNQANKALISTTVAP